ncbi:polyphosphate glucokinase [Methylacidimicrobium cyclopophantes]|uniref:Polyphosphate glucokinase n=1 Tax=Methylacidimicrobium cyclopophantes TaxID=1041766 RepID=A0A5E6MKD2_9BACT|nr:ROK family protein [Methylacidimicrobium cyclopophantes]VVM05963.1 polyphosphate glucokinase [Methylacidimicrobium cyclopophantes]
MKILAVDIGGHNVKLLATGQRQPRKFPSGPAFTPQELVERLLEAATGWSFEAISIGYPGPVIGGKPAAEPRNLGSGWLDFDFSEAFAIPVKVVNDAAMQAWGSYAGGRMLFLGLGTGLGTALILDGLLHPLETAHLPYKKGLTYEEVLGDAGLKRLGKKRWRQEVRSVVHLFREAFQVDYLVVGGGNRKLLKSLPPYVRLGDNAFAFLGGFRLWEESAEAVKPLAEALPPSSSPEPDSIPPKPARQHPSSGTPPAPSP